MSESFRSTVRNTLSGLLPRLRHSIPFPLEPKEVYRAAFPGSKLCDWLWDPRVSDMRKLALPHRNITVCTNKERIVQFSFMTQAEIDELDSDDEIAQFWVRFHHTVVAPPTGGALLLDPAVRCNGDLVKWYNAAVAMEEEINAETTRIYKVVSSIANASELACAWPEVVNAVPAVIPPRARLRIAARTPRIRELRKLVLATWPEGHGMERITDLLATAIMLPPTQLPNAWVGLHAYGMEE